MNRPAPRWRRDGQALVHDASGYRAPCHVAALRADMMPAHVARQPWAQTIDIVEFDAEWRALVKRLPRQAVAQEDAA